MNDTSKIEGYLKHLLVIQLYEAGASQRDISKHLKASLTTVNILLKGVERKQKDEDAKS